MYKTLYDDANLDSVLQYAEALEGKTISELLGNSKKIDIKNKGIIGTIIEEFYFGIKPNSSSLPDFSKIGVELKIIPLVQQIKKLAVKERTKVCSINYMTLINEEWKNSHAKEKLNKILFIYYIYNKENIELSTVKKVSLWELSRDKSEIIIQNDWLKTKEKILDGYAHTLSEKGFHILSPSRSGSGGIDKDGNKKDLVIQPNKLYADKALKRAFSLKQSFTNQLWNEINSLKYESILELLDISSMDEFEVKILKELHKYVGKSIVELSKIFDIEIPNGKNQVATVVKKAIGFKNVNSKIKEFEQLGIIIKTIKVRREDFMPFEAVSFATMKLKEFEREEYDESIFKEYIEKILFVPIFSDGKKLEEKYLAKSFFWSPSEDEEVLIRDEWNRYKSEVLLGGCEVTKVKNNSLRGYREVSKLFKESQTKIIHMRPHGRDSNDRDEDSQGNSIVKQCFWLNKKFLQKLIKQNS